MPGFTLVDLLATALSLLVFSFLYARRKQGKLPFPPGPKRLPVVGNLFDMPAGAEWTTYKRWGELYSSDIVHVDVLGTHIVILNSVKAANELLEKRSSLYSDRPTMKAFSSLISIDWSIALEPYGTRWRGWRKSFHENLHPAAAHEYRPLELKAARLLLRNLLETPEGFYEHLRHMTGRTILSVAYGIDVKDHNDYYISLAKQALDVVAKATEKGRLINLIPALIHFPSWFPGVGFKKEAASWARSMNAIVEEPFAATKKAMVDRTAFFKQSSSYIDVMQNESSNGEFDAKAIASVLQSFVLAMVLYPEAQRKAQEEIDSVVGTERLPDFSDEPSLPYVSALCQEAQRWHPVAPLGIPHRLVSDDVYEGFFLPAGSMVIGNAWAMLHDEAVFPEPEKFKPERFLDPGMRFPDAAFGFGRRTCPGRFMARSSLWIGIASILAAFEISPKLDNQGNPMLPEEKYDAGLISYPAQFACIVRPRTGNSGKLILNSLI
ncbi:cytochrome P450 [Multifurca ochricompacta]|uniref:Cytochrome P450 n=1 Tax=Multifurca ochricompacta TaxID=376703 RepID=A0AAD4M8Y4_9AGAM|nr:cytochrome P450 [Multifurca ochricompacta]